ncbi:glycosyltransferase [Propionibacteriaceae bacterium Y1923]
MRLLVMTRAFPYPPGEQFVAPEAQHWGSATVMPWAAGGTPVELPAGVRVDLTLARAGRGARLLAGLKALVSPLLWSELRWLRSNHRITRAGLAEVAQATRNALLVRDLLVDWTAEHGPIDVVYSYWFDVWTFGALLAKGRGVHAVVTRVHGYDLHEDRHPAGFHALKRQLAPGLDALLPVSRSGGRLAIESFDVPGDRTHHAPLGTHLPEGLSRTSPEGELHLLSVASALPVKRVDRLVDATRTLARSRPDLQVHWRHLGGGPLLADLQARAAGAPDNLHISWAGQVSPDEVAAHLADQPVDLFVNTSESEGVPVSIMEAMAHGVPTLAPRVGAIDEIVHTAQLFSSEPTPDEIATAISDWAQRCKQPEPREEARRIVAERYDADANARRLMDLLARIADQPSRRTP